MSSLSALASLTARDATNSRLPPLGNTFINWAFLTEDEHACDDVPRASVRSRSFPGYISHETDRAAASPRGPERPEQEELALAPQAERSALRTERLRPAALQVVREKVVLVSKADPDEAGGTATTRCSSTWDGVSTEDFEEEDDSTEPSTPMTPATPMTPFTPGGTRKEKASKRSSRGKQALRTQPDANVTTLMIQNLPQSITQGELAAELDKTGFKAQYDFLYMPSAFGTGKGQGYAFVNMHTPAVAHRLLAAWNRKRRFAKGAAAPTALVISPAHIQGHDANVAKWNTPKMKRVRNPSHRPLVIPVAPLAAVAPR